MIIQLIPSGKLFLFLYCDNTVMATNRLDLPPAKVKTVKQIVCAENMFTLVL